MDTREQAELRRALVQATEAQGVRIVSRQVGLSPMSVRNIARGQKLLDKTWAKLREWYAREGGTFAGEHENAAPVLLETFLQHVAPTLRVRVKEAIVGTVGRIYGEAGVPAPAWLTALPAGVAGHEIGANQRQAFATVELTLGARVVLLRQPFPGEPREVIEQLVARGVWRENVYYPPHRVVRVTYDT